MCPRQRINLLLHPGSNQGCPLPVVATYRIQDVLSAPPIMRPGDRFRDVILSERTTANRRASHRSRTLCWIEVTSRDRREIASEDTLTNRRIPKNQEDLDGWEHVAGLGSLPRPGNASVDRGRSTDWHLGKHWRMATTINGSLLELF
jgi:hypothetical protein